MDLGTRTHAEVARSLVQQWFDGFGPAGKQGLATWITEAMDAAAARALAEDDRSKIQLERAVDLLGALKEAVKAGKEARGK